MLVASNSSQATIDGWKAVRRTWMVGGHGDLVNHQIWLAGLR